MTPTVIPTVAFWNSFSLEDIVHTKPTNYWLFATFGSDNVLVCAR